jgi:hypothetical protein
VGPPIGETVFTCGYIGNIFLKSSSQKPLGQKQLKYIEKIFSRTSRPISIKLGTNHPSVKRIKKGPNTGPGSRRLISQLLFITV